MLDTILGYIKALFEEGTDIPATIMQIVNLIVEKVFGIVKEEI